ncbi:prolipoprotein diacylglyceryl transferase [Balneicella halophila]|uniref:Phosphatidylglycerol--prolipoprotein diacylglyceryl transferase n=1 Tax=Balneicella halophila TaxID=1537566 RepID=A0A7L4UQW0_BALHA|nr:prolipoprotein diacylglyceryl transferase [Balneicella halophila]PVX52140.1 prolipoprotein diacylglyceryl transferase [Balneicella halophila]
MHLFNYIDWSPDPEIFNIFGISIRWYGLLFVGGFLIGLKIMEKMFANENINKEWLDPLFMYMIIATLLGARLGHVFFYDWAYFQNHLLEILLPIREQEGASMFFGLIKGWKLIGYAGLASHGGAIGILIALWIFSKKVSKKPMLWILDRIVVPTALVAVFIRTGNLMNSEIIGAPTDLPWGFRFHLASIENPEIPRHPSQIYEALCYLATFIALMYMYWKTEAKDKLGLLFGVFLVMIFTARFFIEFVKENQEAFEESMTLNMGQWLSIPFILVGAYFIIKNWKKEKVV